MESLVEWYANNGKALWATIISFFSAYGVALVSLVIGIVRSKLASIAAQKSSDEKLQELYNKIDSKMAELDVNFQAALNVATEKKIEAMKTIKEEVIKQNEALEEAQTVDTASNALDSIE